MPLGLTTAQKNYNGPVIWTATITDPSGTVHNFAEDFIDPGVFLGPNSYFPYLRVEQGPQRTRSMASNYAQISLVNADLFASGQMAASDWEGCLCVLSEYLLGLQVAVEKFRGVLTQSAQADSGVSWRVVSELDASKIDAQARVYGTACSLRFAQPICGYDAGNSTITSNLGDTAADIFTSQSVGNSGLSLTVDALKGNYAVILSGTGRGQKRRISSNDATTCYIVNQWATTPDATSHFGVVDFSSGAPAFVWTSTGSLPESGWDSITTGQLTRATLALPVGAFVGYWIALVVSSTGLFVSKFKILANTATTVTWDPATGIAGTPGSANVFRILFPDCPKDFAQSCEMRARAHRYDGFATLAADSLLVLSSPESSVIAAADLADGTYNTPLVG